MKLAKQLLCGIAIGLWAGMAFGAEPSGQGMSGSETGSSSVPHWEARTPRRAASSTGITTSWGDVQGSSSVRQTSASAVLNAEPLTDPIKPVPDAAASRGSVSNLGATKRGASSVRASAVTGPGEHGKLDSEINPVTDRAVPMGVEHGEPQFEPSFALDEAMPCPGGCPPCMPILSLSAGVHGFKGPSDQGRTGDFGFQQGVNWSASLLGTGIGYQVGMSAVESNFSQDQTPGTLHDGERDQIFFTAGLFHRAVCEGLQWGVAYDYLRDGYLENFGIHQLRTEVSVVALEGNELGFWGAFGLGSDDFQSGLVEATDIYAFFYRKTMATGSQGRLWAGWTPQGALVGADTHMPLSVSFALEGSFNYLIPQGNDDLLVGGDQKHETWSLAVNLVWYMGRNPGLHHSPVRPLLPLADNSYFLINTRP